jgi:threonine dehydrogenase-like Zn-dependent dehydrogenase
MADGDAETVLGHEGTGVIEQIGAGVQGFQVGDLVTALGGPYAEQFCVAPEGLARLPAGVDPVWALGEPVACCVHAMLRSGIRLGDRVAMVGCGFMGLMCLQLARMQGTSLLCAIEPIPWRREMALQFGADAAHSPEELTAARLLETYGEFDVVIEATGVQPALDLCGDLVRQHGRILVVGYHQVNDGLRTLNMKQWNFKAIDVIMGHVRRDDEKLVAMRAGLELVRAGRLVTEPLVTSYPMDDVEMAFQDLVARKPGLYKAVLVP